MHTRVAKPDNIAVSVDNLSFRYADSERWILRNVSLTVPAGETVLILGPSGCGKSTLALCLNGLIPTLVEGELQGQVRIWGQPVDATFVGEVFQDPDTQMVMPRLDEEVAFGLENMGVAPAEMPARIAAALKLVGLEDRPRAWVDSLSGGQKQRLALAAVLALQPGILVLDEPTANLDPAATVAFFQTLARLKAELGITIVLIEHRLDAVLPLVDGIVAMDRNGQVIAEDTPQGLFAAHASDLEREGIWMPMTCRLMQALRAHGWPSPLTPAPVPGEGSLGCPLTMDEVEAALRGVCGAGSLNISHNADPVVASDLLRRKDSSHSTATAIAHSTAIAIRNLTFAYPDSPPALRNLNLQIERGRFFAIVGGNGSGKTTLAKHVVGLLRPTSGAVEVLGQDTRRRSPGEIAQQVGYVFQNPEHQFVTERVADELAYSLRGRWDADEITRRVKALLATFGLEGYEDENPFALSQGQKRRLSVATMVALDQPILILDEPTFGQDQQSTAALMATLKKLHGAGATIVFITHDMQLVAEYADEVAVMNDGEIIFQGSPRDLFQQPGILQRASLTLPPLADLSHRLGLPPLLTVEEWIERCVPWT